MSVALRSLGTAAALLLWQIEAAPARSLDMIRATGALHLCAHPNSLPYANKAGNPPGFQIELGKALAKELGVTLVTEWIVVPSQASRADCDIILDAIAHPEAQAETGTCTPARAESSRPTAAPGPFGMSIGTASGETRRGPFSRRVS